MAQGRLRLAADIGGTFTDIAVFDDKTGKLTFGKALSTPQRLVDGISAGVDKAGSDYRSRRAVPARLDHRHQHHPGAHRREDRAADHRRLSRHLRDRPHQPAGRLQSVLPEARAAGRARAALRGARARARRRRGRQAARRGRDRGAGRASSNGSASRRSRSCSSTATPIPITRRAPRRSWRSNHPAHVRLGLARAVAGISRVRALLDRRRQRLYRPEGAPLCRRDRRPHAQGRLRRLVPDRAIDRRPLRGRAGARPVRAHAGIRAGRRRHRHPGAVPHARHRQRHRLRHGRHHRQGRRHLQRRGADHRRRR